MEDGQLRKLASGTLAPAGEPTRGALASSKREGGGADEEAPNLMCLVQDKVLVGYNDEVIDIKYMPRVLLEEEDQEVSFLNAATVLALPAVALLTISYHTQANV